MRAKAREWQLPSGLLSRMDRAKVEANTISYFPTISAGENRQEWQLAAGCGLGKAAEVYHAIDLRS